MLKPLLASAVFTAAALTALADTSETYDFTGFDELDIAAGVEVHFATAPDYKVIAEFHRGGPGDIKVRQDGDRLYISRKMMSGGGDHLRVTLTITAPNLNGIEASSGSSIQAEGVSAGNLGLRVTSGASADLSGTCGRLKLKAGSGGNADARDLKCEKVTATASSGGAAKAFASESATSKTSSGGSVDIWGNPPDRSANRSLSGGSTDFH
jgi:hypothetical protein